MDRSTTQAPISRAQETTTERGTIMNTNEQAKQILKLIHEVSGQLLAASEDGKIDMGELIQIGLKNLPAILPLTGLNAGN